MEKSRAGRGYKALGIGAVLVRVSAVLVMVLGGLAEMPFPGLTTLAAEPLASPSAKPKGLQTELKGGYQAITTVFTADAYARFTVKAGIPLKWTVRIAQKDLTGCNQSMIIPAYRIRKNLRPGDNLIEFTPQKAGIIQYSCWMGMIRSAITVADPK